MTNSSIEWDGSTVKETTYTTLLPNGAILDVSFYHLKNNDFLFLTYVPGHSLGFP